MERPINASIVTYHTDQNELRHCLDLLSSSEWVDRIFIIDNSRDGATRLTASQYPNVDYRPSDNIGYGRAHNIALRETLSTEKKIHLVINSDIDFVPDDIEKMGRFMLSDPTIGALQPEITNPDGLPQFTVRLLPTPLDLLARRFLPKRLMRSRRQRYELRNIDRTRPFNAPYHQGSFMMLRTDSLRQSGLFDERFFMYPEDIDLTRRIHQISQTLYYPYVRVVHNHRRESYHSWRMTCVHIVNMIRYFNKWGWLCDADRRRVNRRVLTETTTTQNF